MRFFARISLGMKPVSKTVHDLNICSQSLEVLCSKLMLNCLTLNLVSSFLAFRFLSCGFGTTLQSTRTLGRVRIPMHTHTEVYLKTHPVSALLAEYCRGELKRKGRLNIAKTDVVRRNCPE